MAAEIVSEAGFELEAEPWLMLGGTLNSLAGELTVDFDFELEDEGEAALLFAHVGCVVLEQNTDTEREGEHVH